MKTALIIFSILLPALLFGQQGERYKVVVVDKLDPLDSYSPETKQTQVIPFSQPNQDKSVLMIDTQTGKTWILTKEVTGAEDGGKTFCPSLLWQPVLFRPLSGQVNPNRMFEQKQLKNGVLVESPSSNPFNKQPATDPRREKARKVLQDAGKVSDENAIDIFLKNNPDFK